jgi:choline dehydrogenase
MYHHIVVGAGSAGCVLAARLTENPGTRVLLLEAGGPDKAQELHIPAAFAKAFKGSADWANFTEPCPAMHDRRMFWPRGKVLGGSSSINAMMYVRGHRADFDRWAAAGNDGWGYADVLPYFKKSERHEGGASDYHGGDGPLWVSHQRSPSPLSHAFVLAGIQCGIRDNPDCNGAEQEGIGLTHVNQRRGQRHSAADAFLKPVLDRPNLTVLTGAQATRVLFEGRRATGVRFLRNTHVREALASRGVILAGGAVLSPQLLLLSGVGPADHLRALGIPLIADLPGVGRNLQDHLSAAATYECTEPLTLINAEKPRHLVDYLLFKKGPLTSNVGEALAFVRTDPDLALPDIEIISAPVYFMEHGYANPAGHGITIGVVLLRPKSAGHLELASPDPADPPRIHPNYLADPADLETLVRGLEIARRIAGAPALRAYRGREVWPGEAARSDADLAAHVRARGETLYHPIGTCRMGSDPLAVVDSGLRVRGLDGLWVADASVMPSLPGGHTHAATVMIGEKAADLLRRG